MYDFMLNKIKNISLFLVVTFYVLQLCMLFSSALVERIQEIRNEIQVSKINLAEKKIIPFSKWESLVNKKEIKINNVYYDVLSYEIVFNNVEINAVKDKHENNFRIVLNNLLNKKETPDSSKKKTYKYYSFISTLANNNYKIEPIFNFLPIKQNFNTSTKDVEIIALNIDKPPC